VRLPAARLAVRQYPYTPVALGQPRFAGASSSRRDRVFCRRSGGKNSPHGEWRKSVEVHRVFL